MIAPFNVRYQQQELVYYVQETRAAAVIAAADLVPVVSQTLDGFPDPPALIEIAAELTRCSASRSRCWSWAIRAFQRTLEEAHIPVTLRDSRGASIQAGCGQLRGQVR